MPKTVKLNAFSPFGPSQGRVGHHGSPMVPNVTPLVTQRHPLGSQMAAIVTPCVPMEMIGHGLFAMVLIFLCSDLSTALALQNLRCHLCRRCVRDHYASRARGDEAARKEVAGIH